MNTCSWKSGTAAAERAPHEVFVGLRAEAVYGRGDIQRQVLSYIASEAYKVIAALRGTCHPALQIPVVQEALVGYLAVARSQLLVLEGEAGAGKSALLASCVGRVRGLFPCAKLFYHFVGAAPGSTDLVRLLRRLWLELAPDRPVPPSEDALVRSAVDLLEQAGRSGGAVLFIDALNQLDADSAQSELQWLPSPLPAGVRCVVSVIGGTEYHKLLLSKCAPVRVSVGALDSGAREQIVRTLLPRDAGAGLDEDTTRQLLAKRGCLNPLWLVSACEELKATVLPSASREAVGLAIDAFADDLLELLQQMLARVEAQHDRARTVAAFCLLECSRHGLFGSELRALLADGSRCRFVEAEYEGEAQLVSEAANCGSGGGIDILKDRLHSRHIEEIRATNSPQDSVVAGRPEAVDLRAAGSSQAAGEPRALPMDTWLPIFQSLRPFLRPVGSSCESHLDFFHRAVSKAVRLRYLSKEAAGRSSPGVSPREGAQQSGPWRERDERRYTFWHGRLADFFEHCTDAQRRAEELPYHLEKVLDNSGLLRSIVQWEVFSRLATVSRGLELMRFCRAAGGYGAVAVALREQLELASAGGLSSERLASRKLLVAEFLTQAGEAGHAISILEESLRESRLRQRPATRALLLGLLADAMLVQICFGRMSAEGVRQVPLILEEAVSLWRSVSEGERDEAALAQALSNLCYQYSQVGPTQLAEAAGREAIDIYSRLGHPRLAQAEQHMGHVLHRKRMDQEAMAMYRRSVNTFERFGTARFDTEHACSLSSIATLMDDARGLVAWQRAAVASCEAITGRDHQEAAHYRRQLAVYLEAVGETEEAQRVADGGDVAVSAEDIEVMRSSSG